MSAPTTSDSSNQSIVNLFAKQDFDAARRKGYWRSVLSWLSRSDNSLLPFDEFRRNLPPHGQHDIGIQQIEMDQIIGSVGRYQDFDRAFLPTQSHTRGRWESVDKAHLQEISLPPIEVYKIGTVYFVKDGNHRVSVARERGQVYIDAYVTQIDVPFPVDEKSQIDDLIRQSEAASFEMKTRLLTLRPESKVHLSLPGGYGILSEHIDVHRWYLGEDRKAEVPYEVAVTSWYDEVYMPLVRVIRRYRILENFPGRTEADLYLWIIEHLYYLREQLHNEITLEQAATHFAKEYSPGLFTRLVHFIQRLIK